MKKNIYIALIMSLLPLSGNAQITLGNTNTNANANGSTSVSSEEIKKNILRYSQETALLLGYAEHCNFEKHKVDKISSDFYPTLDFLATTYQKEIKEKYIQTYESARKNGPKITNQTCEQFKLEFDKIYQSSLLKEVNQESSSKIMNK